MTQKEYIEELLTRYMEGLTTEQEEEVLADYFTSAEDIPQEWEEYRLMFMSYETDAFDLTTEEMEEATRPAPDDEAPVEMKVTAKAHPPRRMRLWLAAAACVAAVCLALPALWSTFSAKSPDAVCYIYGQEITDEDAVMEIMEGTMSDVFDNDADVDEQLSELFQ